MSPTQLYHYIVGFVLSITWLLPGVAKAAQQANVNITTSLATSKVNKAWHSYPRAIQLRSGAIIGKSNKEPIVVMPTTIDADILYIHPFFARQLDTYPRVGLSILVPYPLQKEQKLRFPNIWGILAYIELYQSDPSLSTWGNRISVGAVKGGTLVRAQHAPNYSFVATEEVTYHWLCAPSWQLNFGMGLLINGWTKNKKDKVVVQDKVVVNTAGPPNTQPLNNKENHVFSLKFAPLATIGIRYIAHTASFLTLRHNPIHYRQRKSSRVDCSIAGSRRWLASTQAYHFIFRGSVLLNFPINAHNALLCSLELGHNWYKKALLTNMLSVGGMEVTTLGGYEVRYGRFLLQLQLGFELIDAKKPAIETEDTLSDLLERRGSCAVHAQYMLTESFFVGISARSGEIPALRLGLSF
ncbi:MAG: hypothetical protein NMK33_02325 [Candidatus Cardinium sp.]|uniref:hypothetical protein n=1 Tax=Cardinium endosymbiont of Dermatophagoides farinae TaxID=2597823 RepID=UPI001182E064|nr:hypothetical protein [Cardinium endosymbiont of Dermatophagoides farinae]TSJ81314.1 hypothetical protein FPG78_04985 [Cardinium endosymbiont of Dermatophagoides farinae]UWW97378.1 MAG: hypothetical protein NMK33_02325 [Candidatus Cardinium sp.]